MSGLLSCVEPSNVKSTEVVGHLCLHVSANVSSKFLCGIKTVLMKDCSIIIAIAFRLATYDPAGLMVDPTFREVLFVVWTQVELHFSIIFATIPVLRPVVNNLNTSYSSLGPLGPSPGHGGSSGTYKLSKLNPPSTTTGASNALPASSSVTVLTSKTNTGLSAISRNSTQILNVKRRASPDADSIGSHSSEQMIIRKQVSWRVEHGTTEGLQE